jgi:hypothetical protein
VSEAFDLLGDAGVVLLVESDYDVFEMGEDVLLADFDLPSSFGLCALEVEIAEGADEVVSLLRGDGV